MDDDKDNTNKTNNCTNEILHKNERRTEDESGRKYNRRESIKTVLILSCIIMYIRMKDDRDTKRVYGARFNKER